MADGSMQPQPGPLPQAPPPQGTPVKPGPGQPQPQPPAPQGQPVVLSYSYTQPQQQPQAQGYPGSASASAPQGTLPLYQREHVHHSYVWLNILQVASAILVMMIIMTIPLVFGQTGQTPAGSSVLGGMVAGVGIILLCVLILGIAVIFSILSYRNLYYEIDEEGFNLYSGILNKKRMHVPYQRVQSVNQRATLIQRIVGVCTLNIDTAGGASNKAVVVPYMQNTRAEQLRLELFARKKMMSASGTAAQASHQAAGLRTGAQDAGGAATVSGQTTVADQAPRNILDAPAELMSDVRGVFGNQEVDTGAITYRHGLSNRELVLTGISNNASLVLLIATVAIALSGVASQLYQTAIGQWVLESSIDAASRIVVPEMRIWVLIGLLIGIILAAWVFSVIATCIGFGGFKATRRGSRIEVERGLLQHRFQGVDIDRVQSVNIKQSFIRRIFGYCELSLGKIDAVQQQSDGQQQTANIGLVVHPFVKMDRIPEILTGLVPEFADVPTDVRPVSEQALRRAIIRRGFLMGNGFWLAVATTVAFVLVTRLALPAAADASGLVEAYVMVGASVLYALSLLLLIIEIIGAVLWYRGSGYAYNNSFMQVTNGGFSRECVRFPRKKIQYGFTSTNPFQNRAHTRTIFARTAAGIGGTSVRLVDVREAEADAWLDWVKPRRQVKSR